MQVQLLEADDRVVLTGRLDVHCAADVRAVLLAALAAGSGDLVVDLAAVPAVDPTGLGALLEAHRRAQRTGRRLVLLDVPPALWRLVLRTRLDRILVVQRSRADVA